MATFPDGTYLDKRIAPMHAAAGHPPHLSADEIYGRQGLATTDHLPSNLSLQADGRGPRDFNHGDVVAWDSVAEKFRPFTREVFLSGGGGPAGAKGLAKYLLGLVGPATTTSPSPVSSITQILSGSTGGLFDTLVPHTEALTIGAGSTWNTVETSWPIVPSGAFPFQVPRSSGDTEKRYLFLFSIRVIATASGGTLRLECADATGFNAGQPVTVIGAQSIATADVKETVVQFSHVMVPSTFPTWACAMNLQAEYTPPPAPDGDVLMQASLTIVEL